MAKESKHFWFKLFQSLLVPFSTRVRARRMSYFQECVKPFPGMKILDIGGQPGIWDSVEVSLEITCLNLPGVMTVSHQSHHLFSYVEGDGCAMPQYERGNFDFVFCNSVIEHVGNSDRRRELAVEIKRLSDHFWVQTPHKMFPIEAHCGMPFWWYYPEALRRKFIERWRVQLPEWTVMVEETVVVKRSEMKKLFPNAKIGFEWLLFPKSVIVHTEP